MKGRRGVEESVRREKTIFKLVRRVDGDCKSWIIIRCAMMNVLLANVREEQNNLPRSPAAEPLSSPISSRLVSLVKAVFCLVDAWWVPLSTIVIAEPEGY